MALREGIGQALAELIEDELPDPLIGAEMQERLQDIGHAARSPGHDASSSGSRSRAPTRRRFVADLRETAATAVKVDLALRAVVAAEGHRGDR